MKVLGTQKKLCNKIREVIVGANLVIGSVRYCISLQLHALVS
jgi:hypothetical protein